MNRWMTRWLSLEGRITLVTSVLQSILVYWFSLYRVPTRVLLALHRSMFRFLWAGAHDITKFHFSGWDSFPKPKSWGGWGIKQLSLFSQSLCAKNLWRGLTVPGLWGNILKAKYLKILP